MASVNAEKFEEEAWQENLNSHLICPDCKEVPPNLVEEFSSGDMVCGDCGLVLGGRIVDTRSEWRTFSNDDQNNDDPSRVGDGPNLLLNGDQLQTNISFGDGSKAARDLARAQNKSTQDKGNKALMAAYKQIGNLGDNIGLSAVIINHSKHLFKIIHDANAFRGKPQDTLIASCIFVACRQCDSSRTFKDIYKYTGKTKKEVGRMFKLLMKFFQARKETSQNSQDVPDATSSAKAAELCIRYCSDLRVGPQVTKVSQLVAEKMSGVGALAGRSPLSAAAACIYLASHLLNSPRSAKDIGGVVGVSDGTIRTSYKLLLAKKDELIDLDWIKDGKGDMSLLPKP